MTENRKYIYRVAVETPDAFEVVYCDYDKTRAFIYWWAREHQVSPTREVHLECFDVDDFDDLFECLTDNDEVPVLGSEHGLVSKD